MFSQNTVTDGILGGTCKVLRFEIKLATLYQFSRGINQYLIVELLGVLLDFCEVNGVLHEKFYDYLINFFQNDICGTLLGDMQEVTCY